MNNEDKHLVQQTLNGNTNSFSQLVQKYQATVYGLAYHWTKNFSDAQDLTQETFFAAYQNLDGLRDHGKFAIWLRRIATNLCRMWRRGQQDLLESIDAPGNRKLLDTLQDAAAQPPEALEVRERQKAVSDVLALLPDKIRLTATLFYVDQFSYREISGFLGVPITTVESRLYKARKTLKEEAIQMVQKAFGKQRTETKFEIKKASGFLHIEKLGFGFLRPTVDVPPSPDDIYVSPSQIRCYQFKNGDFITGEARPPKSEGDRKEGYFALLKIETINNAPLKKVSGFLHIEEAGHALLRPTVDASASPNDIYVYPSEILRFDLKCGDFIQGLGRTTKPGGEEVWERYPPLVKIETINHKEAISVAKKKVEGFLHARPERKDGFLRPTLDAFPSRDDIYVDYEVPIGTRFFQLKHGDFITGEAAPPRWVRDPQKCYFGLTKIETINRKGVSQRRPKNENKPARGFLHISDQVYGFLRPFIDAPPSKDDIYVSPPHIRRLNLKEGDLITGTARAPKKAGDRQERYCAMIKIEQINNQPATSRA